MKKTFFIVLEGLSGTGKTTIAKQLAKTLGAVYYKTPPSPFLLLRNFSKNVGWELPGGKFLNGQEYIVDAVRRNCKQPIFSGSSNSN